MTGRVGQLVREFRDGLVRLYGPRLRGVYLYGSYARDEADPESDVDVLVVLDDVAHYGREVERTAELAAALSLAHGLSVSQVFVREADWLHGETPFLANVREEGVLA